MHFFVILLQLSMLNFILRLLFVCRLDWVLNAKTKLWKNVKHHYAQTCKSPLSPDLFPWSFFDVSCRHLHCSTCMDAFWHRQDSNCKPSDLESALVGGSEVGRTSGFWINPKWSKPLNSSCRTTLRRATSREVAIGEIQGFISADIDIARSVYAKALIRLEWLFDIRKRCALHSGTVTFFTKFAGKGYYRLGVVLSQRIYQFVQNISHRSM